MPSWSWSPSTAAFSSRNNIGSKVPGETPDLVIRSRKHRRREHAQYVLPHCVERATGWLPKGAIQARYCLDDEDLEGLDSIEKHNPYGFDWSKEKMILYKQSAAFKRALEKYGDVSALAEVVQQRNKGLLSKASVDDDTMLERNMQGNNSLVHVPQRLRVWISTLTLGSSSKGRNSGHVVLLALAGNFSVACSKLVAFFMTGSGSMLSEGVHSIADLVNQSLLVLGMSEATKTPDKMHPYGYASEKYVWALISGVGIFFLGCGVSVYHGILALLYPVPIEAHPILPAVLSFAFLVESITLGVALKEVRKAAQEQELKLWEYIRRASDPNTVAVLAEDSAAVLGLLLAGTCIGLTYKTGLPVFDAVGSILVGSLLGVVAVFLIRKNHSFLLGQSMDPFYLKQVMEVIRDNPMFLSVHDVKSVMLGPEAFRFKAEVVIDGQVLAEKLCSQIGAVRLPQTQPALKELLLNFGDQMVHVLGDEIDILESRIRKRVPQVRHVDLEII